MLRQKRLAAMLLCLGMVLALLLSSAFIACEAGHECTGETCAICECLARTEALLQSFALLYVAVVLLLPPASVKRPLCVRDFACPYVFPTLVHWKVRLND